MIKVIYIPWNYTNSENKEYEEYIRTKFRRKYANIQFQKETKEMFDKRTSIFGLIVTKPSSNHKPIRTRDIYCLVCTGRGHYSEECPNLKHQPEGVLEELLDDGMVNLKTVEKIVQKEVDGETFCPPKPMEYFLEDFTDETFVKTCKEENASEVELAEEISPISVDKEVERGALEIVVEKVHDDRPHEEDTTLLDTSNAAPILPLISVDPFLVNYSPLDYVVADFFKLGITTFGRIIAALFIHFLVVDDGFYDGIIRCVWSTFIFDPGGFEDESFRRRRE